MLSLPSALNTPGSRPWFTNSALALLGLALVGLCRRGSERDSSYMSLGFSLVAMYQALLYLVAVWVVLNQPVNRCTLVIILVCAAGVPAVCLFSPPFLDGYLPLRMGWTGAGRRHQSISLHPSRRFTSGIPSRSGNLPTHQPARLCPQDLPPGGPDALPADHQNRRIGEMDEDGLWLGWRRSPSGHLVELLAGCRLAPGTGVDLRLDPLSFGRWPAAGMWMARRSP